MPPKSKKNEPSKKTLEKAKTKVVEDKTFGLKNKKGNKQQKFIQQVEKTVMSGGSKTAKQIAKEQEEKFAKKDAKKREKAELNDLFRPVEQKVAKGADPKSVLCAFFKAGSCSKGDKCKFSHDLNIQRKGEKRNMFAKEEEKDNMEDWDEAKLEDVVNKKHGESNKKKMETKIICKFFLDAVENSKYGWFWECPTGPGCHYKHCLPEGFVLKKDMKKAEEGKEKISLEELIEKERAALGSNNLTMVNLETFLKWKEKKKKEKIAALKKEKDAKKSKLKAGQSSGISGREMFEFNPDLIMNEMDDEDGGGDLDLSKFKREDDGDDDTTSSGVVEIDLAAIAAAAQEVDGTGSKRGEVAPAAPTALTNGVNTPEDDSCKLSIATGGASAPDDPGSGQLTNGAPVVDIDENLFDDDDLLDIDQELETLELEE